jgi:hypothetical protein
MHRELSRLGQHEAGDHEDERVGKLDLVAADHAGQAYMGRIGVGYGTVSHVHISHAATAGGPIVKRHHRAGFPGGKFVARAESRCAPRPPATEAAERWHWYDRLAGTLSQDEYSRIRWRHDAVGILPVGTVPTCLLTFPAHRIAAAA